MSFSSYLNDSYMEWAKALASSPSPDTEEVQTDDVCGQLRGLLVNGELTDKGSSEAEDVIWKFVLKQKPRLSMRAFGQLRKSLPPVFHPAIERVFLRCL